MDQLKTLGEELKKIRVQKKVSTYKLYKDHKLRIETIYALEEGNPRAEIASYIRYANALGYRLSLMDLR